MCYHGKKCVCVVCVCEGGVSRCGAVSWEVLRREAEAEADVCACARRSRAAGAEKHAGRREGRQGEGEKGGGWNKGGTSWNKGSFLSFVAARDIVRKLKNKKTKNHLK